MKKKYIIILMLIGVFFLLLAGCNSSDYNNTVKPYEEEECSSEPAIAYSVGDIVKFGRCEQDIYSDGKEEIEWIVLAVQDNRILVVSKRILDCAPYNNITKDVTWETCTLRSWLNGAFLTETFTSEELVRIPFVTVPNDNSPELGRISGGNDTTDRVFLLSIDEAQQYFQSNDERQASGTEYAKEHNLSVAENGYSLWRLRSPGASADYAATVSYAGEIIYIGADVSFKRGGIRPAMWIDINS